MRDQRAANTAYYARNRLAELRRVRQRQAATLEMLRDLRRRPCADCGGLFEPHQMDFDHRDRSTKSFRISAGRAMLMSRDRLMAEVSKCDIVCANCHRVRTRDSAVWVSTTVPAFKGSRRLLYKRDAWRAQAQLLQELRAAPCADCRGRFPPCAMDFDHRDGTDKRYTVTRMVGRAGTQRILAEVAKCDIVCANCHRRRTYVRRQARLGERE